MLKPGQIVHIPCRVILVDKVSEKAHILLETVGETEQGYTPRIVVRLHQIKTGLPCGMICLED